MPPTRAAALSRHVDAALVAFAMLALGVTVWLSLADAGPDLGIPDRDKVGHAIAYFAVLLPLLFAVVWRPGRGLGRIPNAALALVLGTLWLGVAMEVLQATLTATRSPEVLDVAADAVGTGAAVLVFAVVRRVSSDGPTRERRRR